MASNKIKAFALTSAIAMAAVIGSTTLAEARYCRAHYGWHRHCGSYWGYSYRPVRYSRCYRPAYYGSAWPGYGYNAGYYGYGGGGLLGAGLGTGLGLGAGLGAGIGSGLFGWW
ncbi:hypothetical protein [Methylocystis sp.]|uniref:hypothetical protein n=1 Tax=Methylocystis sp. TaxID=1911079 RepID=UPI0025D65803|nr:hypothetical protein [Methylocystis sp.]